MVRANNTLFQGGLLQQAKMWMAEYGERIFFFLIIGGKATQNGFFNK